MIRLWKNFRINLMYWRFRYITRNRLRFQSWLRTRRMPSAQSYRPRASAMYVYRRSSRRTWTALLVMVALLAAFSVLGSYYAVSQTLIYLLSAAAVIGAIYWAARGLY